MAEMLDSRKKKTPEGFTLISPGMSANIEVKRAEPSPSAFVAVSAPRMFAIRPTAAMMEDMKAKGKPKPMNYTLDLRDREMKIGTPQINVREEAVKGERGTAVQQPQYVQRQDRGWEEGAARGALAKEAKRAGYERISGVLPGKFRRVASKAAGEEAGGGKEAGAKQEKKEKLIKASMSGIRISRTKETDLFGREGRVSGNIDVNRRGDVGASIQFTFSPEKTDKKRKGEGERKEG